MTAKTKTLLIAGPGSGRHRGTNHMTTYLYYTPLSLNCQLVALYRQALDRERYHQKRLHQGGQHAGLLARHRAVRTFLGVYLGEYFTLGLEGVN